ncbi:16S rRNA processing protein RimM [Wenzhouxiangella sp. AB-CW3]|uniref:ribosome maturation factor RimM n=1 Tax=Wenzhouxiangella sp. AB-CW3 TaxID=2771012 RepID=UPI00168B01D4|nr:ribosome maturation factor RimM [Wenzhouxiangella sp. AB-CW3]QOC23487.1 16S rRNA processing protein RimM [Wenzhouxiangella sp. AB-CW3]
MDGPRSSEPVVVGRFNGPWGVQGWVRVFSHTRPPAAIFDYGPWLAEDGTEVVVEDWRKAGPRLVARLSGISTPEQAAALGRSNIRVARSELPESTPGHYYWHDLIGLEVYNLQQHHFGQVAALIETGAHDVLDVRGGTRDTILIPFVIDEFVREVDLDQSRIVVDWPLEWIDDAS